MDKTYTVNNIDKYEQMIEDLQDKLKLIILDTMLKLADLENILRLKDQAKIINYT